MHFLGLRRDIPDILAASDIFVSASAWEGAPVSLLEAMANGLPPVVTDVGENRRVLQDTGARLVPPRDPAALAEPLMETQGTVGVLAGVTKRVRLGTAVLVVPYLNPVLLAPRLLAGDLTRLFDDAHGGGEFQCIFVADGPGEILI